MTDRPTPPLLLAQVPAAELAACLDPSPSEHLGERVEVRRRASLPRARKRLAASAFLGLGIMSILGLSRGAGAARSDGFGSDDALLLTMLGLISLVVISQGVALAKTLPGIRALRTRLIRARLARSGPGPSRPLLAQANARALLSQLEPEARGGGRLRSGTRTAGWVALTLLIMAVAMVGTAFAAWAAIGSVADRGWNLGTVLGLGMFGLIAYGVGALDIGLVRSWFERRRRRLRRMVMRLLRYLLRLFDRTTVALNRMLGRFDRGAGLLGRAVLATGGASLVLGASLSIPSAAAGDTSTGATGSPIPPTSTSTTVVHAVGIDHSDDPAPAFGTNAPESDDRELIVSAPAMTVASTTTVAGASTPTTAATTTSAAKATTTTVVKTTTTTTVVKTTTTSSTTTSSTTSSTTTTVADTTGPTVGGVSDGPDPIFTSGNPPDTSQVSAAANDPSGVANMTVYYRLGGGGFAVWTTVKGGSVSTTFGPFGTIGTYEYRIMATDTLGNSNCKTPGSCPGGTITVIIP